MYGVGALPRTAGVKLDTVRRLNEDGNQEQQWTKNEGYYVNAADLADKMAVLMQYGLDPLFISTSTWALVQTRQYQASTERKC